MALGEEGRRRAELTAGHLAEVKLAAVYASPIERTWETAEIVAARHGLTPVAEEGLLEVDYGRWSGRTLASLAKLKAWRSVQLTPSRVTFPGGESIAAAQRRAVETCERLAASHGKSTIALVTHADIVKAIVSHYLGQALDLFQRIMISPGSVSVIEVPRQGIPVVVCVNAVGVGEGSA